MKIFLGLLDSAAPRETRIFGEIDGKLVDLRLTYAAYLAQTQNNPANGYDRAAFFFPSTIAVFLERGEPSRHALNDLIAFAQKQGVGELRGPQGERVAYEAGKIRLLPPLQNPEKSFVIGFSDKARIEAMPKAEIPTGFYKLPQTFVTNGAPIVLPRFAQEVDADACLAIVIGKAGKRINPENAWDHVAGATLVIDVTARDVNRREGATNNNLLGKNFPSSTCIGPALWLANSRQELETLTIELAVDGAVQQQFALRDCVFTIEQIVARWSILGIKPGDWFAIGASMALRGDRLQNPVALRPGAKIRCSSPAIGALAHDVISAGGMRR